MRYHPFLFQQVRIDRQRRERIFCNEPEIRVNWAEHSEDARFLHPLQLAPKILLCEYVGQMKLRLELFDWRKQRQLNFIGAERVHGERV